MSKKIFIVLSIILFIAFFLRFWQLGKVPPSPDWDEAALGYNAYSIMQTGRDEYGKMLPIILRSFDDYKPALYSYLIIPFIKLFDLNILSVRLPSTIFGTLTVLAVFFLAKELFKRNDIALLSCFLLSISPWHIQFSRVAFESNVGLSLNVFSVLFFLKSFKKPWLILLSVFLLTINFYVYQSEKVFTPLLFIALILIFRKQVFSLPKKYLIASLILGLIISLPMINYTLTNKEALARAKGVSIFSDLTPLLTTDSQRLIQDKSSNDFLGLVLDNRRVIFAKSILSGYLSHFDFNWLFITGDLSRHHAPNMGLLYLWELPFLVIGIYKLIFGNFDKKTKFFIFSWFLLTPIPASITSGVPHAVRTLNFLPTFQIFVAIGLLSFLHFILKFKIKYVAFGTLILFTTFNFTYYLNQYFVQQNYFNSEDWQYGYEKTTSIIKKIEGRYDKIIVSNKPYLDQSYIFFLFYLKYSPSVYQKETLYTSGGFKENHKYGKFEFRPIEWEKEIKDPKILYVGAPSDFLPSAKIIETINFLDNKPAIQIIEG